jgi:hypothetical protein
MGVFTDWLDNQIVLGERPYTGERRIAYNEINWHKRRTDPDHHAAYVAQNERQGATQAIPQLAQFRLGFTTPDGVDVETGNMPAMTIGAALEAAIGAAVGGLVDGWTDGDIEWISGAIAFPPLILEYSGDSVARQDWGDLRAWMVWPFFVPLTTTTYQDGHGIRYTWSVMYELGLYGPPPPQPGEDLPDDAELLMRPDETIRWPSGSLRDKLAQQCAIEESNPELEGQLQDLFNIQRRWGVNPQ